MRLALRHARAMTVELAALSRPTSCRRCSCRRCSSSSSSRPGRRSDATVRMATFAGFAVIGVAFFQFGVGIAIDRASPWETYLRTLPVGPAVRLGARLALGGRLRVRRRGAARRHRGRRDRRLAPAARWAGLAARAARRHRAVRVARDRARLLGARRGALPIANLLYLGLAYAGGLWIPPATLPARGRGDLAVPADAGALRRARRHGARRPVAWGAWASRSPASRSVRRLLAVAGYRRDEGTAVLVTLRVDAATTCVADVGVPYTSTSPWTLWEIIFMLVILKIPVVYVGWVIWWAIKAEPELGAEGGTEGVNWKPWRRPSPAPRPAVAPRRLGSAR